MRADAEVSSNERDRFAPEKWFPDHLLAFLMFFGMAPCWGRCRVELGQLFIQLRRWLKSPCQVESTASAFESAIRRFDERLIETDDFSPELGRSDVSDQVVCLVRSFYTVEPAAEWADCEVQRNRTHCEAESNAGEIVSELTGDFATYMIPFDCFTVLSPEDRRPLWECFARSTRGYRKLLEIGGNHLQAHNSAASGEGEVRCNAFVEQVEDAVVSSSFADFGPRNTEQT